MKTIIILLSTFSCYSQKLHHQMLSSQGATTDISGGITISQTIGQQSVIRNFRNSNFFVGSGFQQSNKMKSSSSKTLVVSTKTYPNPFIDKLSFQFSSTFEGTIKISLFDVLGRLVFSDEKLPIDNLITVDNLFLSEGEYFAKLTANNFTYTTNLLKTK